MSPDRAGASIDTGEKHMEALQATPEIVEKIFDRCYRIPEYQRPYSWEREQCEKLWEDLRDFADSSPDKQDQYFLGNIVL